MGLVIAIAVAAGLYLVLDHQHAGMAPGIYGNARGYSPNYRPGPGGLGVQVQGISPDGTVGGDGGGFGTDLSYGQQGFGDFSSLAGSGALGAGLQASSAIPIAGAVIGIGASIYGAITRHHQQAVAKEGQGMAAAIPHWNQGLVLVIKAAAAGAYGHGAPVNTAQMERDIQQNFQDYLRIVGSFLRGNPQITWTHASFNPKTRQYSFQSGNGGPHQDPCNGPCSYAKGYFWWQADEALRAAIKAARGIHGTFSIAALPANPGKKFSGAAGVNVSW